ncbi:unnamed protein product [Bursaphelenchus okinawaensis]|uniref:Cyclin-like domain-containing protein n=1 Tax=Bursaphelenchus okinawaensis TaxID=465554 RepID=A0A811K6C7_9BILA|nr:unnamed protein product [Bursaphelenchus okinawaensis]CAG9092457.1 unnamed protein product [Bursaphelenchus okinawaensis]
MLTESATMGMDGFWCSEYLLDSPSTSKDSGNGSCAAPSTTSSRTSSSRKRPLSAVLENKFSLSKEGPLPKRLHSETKLETVNLEYVVVDFDRALQSNLSLVKKLLNRQKNVDINIYKMQHLQKEGCIIKERCLVTHMMSRICNKHKADLAVFPLAVQILDRFLSVQMVPQRCRMYVGLAALLLASKMKSTRPLTTEILAQERTYNTVTIQKWEKSIAAILRWDFNNPTAVDFFDCLVSQSEELADLRDDFFTVLDDLQRDLHFASLYPSEQMAIVLFYLRDMYQFELIEDNIYSHFELDADVIQANLMLLHGTMRPAPLSPTSSTYSDGCPPTPNSESL